VTEAEARVRTDFVASQAVSVTSLATVLFRLEVLAQVCII
jgi:hypothetical protein